MTDPTPSPPESHGKSAGLPKNNPATASPSRTWEFAVCLCKYWWVPLLTVFLGLGVAIALVFAQSPTFVSKTTLWQTEKLRLPDGAQFTEDMQNFMGTQLALLRSEALNQLALARLKSLRPEVAIPLGKEGEPLPVTIRVSQFPKSSVFTIEAASSNPAYVQTYLDALTGAYLEYKKNIRTVTSGSTLASLSAEVQRAERDLRADQEMLNDFQRTNNLAVMQVQEAVALDCLKRLNAQLSDLQLEDLQLKRSGASQAETSSSQIIQLKLEHIRNSIKQWENKIVEVNGLMLKVERLKENIQRDQSPYEQLVKLLQNMAIGRNLNLETLSILEPASAAKRSYTRAKDTLMIAGLVGLCLGLGIIGLKGLRRARRCSPAKS